MDVSQLNFLEIVCEKVGYGIVYESRSEEEFSLLDGAKKLNTENTEEKRRKPEKAGENSRKSREH